MSKQRNPMKAEMSGVLGGDEMPLDDLSKLTDKLSQQLAYFAAGDNELQQASIGKMLATAKKMYHVAGRLFSTVEFCLVKQSRDINDASRNTTLRTIILQVLVARREMGLHEPIGVKQLQQQLLREGVAAKLTELRSTLNGLMEIAPPGGKVGCTSGGQYLILPSDAV